VRGVCLIVVIEIHLTIDYSYTRTIGWVKLTANMAAVPPKAMDSNNPALRGAAEADEDMVVAYVVVNSFCSRWVLRATDELFFLESDTCAVKSKDQSCCCCEIFHLFCCFRWLSCWGIPPKKNRLPNKKRRFARRTNPKPQDCGAR